MRRFEGSNVAVGQSFNKPDSPSIITWRVSLCVAPITPARRSAPLWMPWAMKCAPASVLPAPRPPRNNQMRQAPDGACCSGRSQNDKRSSISFASLGLRLEKKARLLLSLKEFTQAAFKSGDHVFGALCRPGSASDGTIILHLE